MATRVRQEKEGKTQKGTRGEGRNRFFGIGIEDFERTNNRCESLIIMVYYLFVLFLWIDETECQRGFKKHKAVSKLAQLVEHCTTQSNYDRLNLFQVLFSRRAYTIDCQDKITKQTGTFCWNYSCFFMAIRYGISTSKHPTSSRIKFDVLP